MIKYIYYEKFYDIPEDKRKIILKRLGISGGTMRRTAKHRNPECVVAYDDTETPIAWVTLITYPKKKFEINVFVSTPFRKRGIGTKLLELVTEKLPEDKLAFVYPYNNAGLALFSKFSEEERLKIL